MSFPTGAVNGANSPTTLFVLCMLLCTAAIAQPDAKGVWQYNAELEGHHCDDAGCYAFCTSSYLENSNLANNSEPSRS
ncbi:hypothetical protein GGR26_002823 [Lewinella marina]|uniref:Uncharacterized protein n=1 Tax=Neolewinella marina TaxID=438751 RepID=A0A2G0CBQ9_9BACT|nr:hypothetical protein [Neolewinella marina]PHK97418.1 hypothetical protein CGL56_16585 [Neolewinella marina]